jgi:hypothetical protein
MFFFIMFPLGWKRPAALGLRQEQGMNNKGSKRQGARGMRRGAEPKRSKFKPHMPIKKKQKI